MDLRRAVKKGTTEYHRLNFSRSSGLRADYLCLFKPKQVILRSAGRAYLYCASDPSCCSTMSSSTEHTNGADSHAADDMKPAVSINPQRASTLFQSIASIRARISSTLSSSSSGQQNQRSPPRLVRLVAVSKLKPASDILALHTPPTRIPLPDIPFSDPTSPTFGDHENITSSEDHGSSPQEHFGENYVQELIEKSRLLPRTIKWHFIGGLQSNKCAQLAREVDGLWAVESVDSEKKANLLNKGRGERNERVLKATEDSEPVPGQDDKLRVFIQVNTSGEESKSGIDPESPDLLSLAKYIHSDDSCPNLQLQGLMTIGAIARSKATTPETENEDFITLKATRDKLAGELGMDDPEALELSMGMSDDFESAIRLGSSEVRVGSTIFGERPPKKEAKVLDDVEGGKK
jgi:PLP dependent protein